MQPREILKKYFGYTDFRPFQEEIVTSILNKKNVLAVLPTGGGKSICYQIPAIMADHYSIVVSPLIALMKDQVDALNSKTELAAFLNSTLDYREVQNVQNKIARNEIKLLYVSPEKLAGSEFIQFARNNKPHYVFVDEAHCISEWGHSFRPSYRSIKSFCEQIENKNISAFTATAIPEVRQDIIDQLGFENSRIIVSGFGRDNLSIKVVRSKTKKDLLTPLLKNSKPAIVYTSTRRNAEEAASFLTANKINAAHYHAGLTNELRRMIQDDFANDRLDVVCATNAFGMGIDKSNIRTIIHYNLPGSIENYYQEIGRAGRDGNESKAVLIYDDQDIAIHKYLIDLNYPDTNTVRTVYNLICDYASIAVGSGHEDQISIDKKFIQFAGLNNISRSLLVSSIKMLESVGYITESGSSADYFAQFNLQPNALKQYIHKIRNKELGDFILLLVRTEGDKMFGAKTRLNVNRLAQIIGVNHKTVAEFLVELENLGIIQLDKPSKVSSVKLNESRVKAEHLRLDEKQIEEKKNHALNKLEAMRKFVETSACRFQYILKYFGETDDDYKCGKCDICTGDIDELKIDTKEYIDELIISTVHEIKSPMKKKDLIKLLNGSSKHPGMQKFSNFGALSHFKRDEIDTRITRLVSSQKLIEYNSVIQISDGTLDSILDDNKEDAKQLTNYDNKLILFNQLNEARKNAAIKFSQKPEIICPDSLLREIVNELPDTPSKFMTLNNSNNRIFNKVGEDFLEIIREHKQKISVDTKFKESGLPEPTIKTYELVKKRYSLTDIVSLTKLPEAVVSLQIESIIKLNPETDIFSLLENSEYKIIKAEIEKGITDLKQIKENIGKNISYGKIRIVLAKESVS